MVLVQFPIPLPLPLRVVFCAFLYTLRTTLNFAFQFFQEPLLSQINTMESFLLLLSYFYSSFAAGHPKPCLAIHRKCQLRYPEAYLL